MSWKLDQAYGQKLTSEAIYELLKHHRLLPESIDMAVSMCNRLGGTADVYFLQDEEGDSVATILVSDIVDGDSMSMDLIPVPRFFRTGFDDDLTDAVRPLLARYFDKYNIRRVNALVPASRSKTKRALCTLGFVVEGRKREAIKLAGKDPEDLRVLGLLHSDFEKGEQT